MAICIRCNINERLSIKSRLNFPYCSECKRAYDRDYYAKNQIKQSKVRNSNIKKQRVIKRQYITNYLKTHPCIDCGETDHIVLEFDHKDPKTKSFNIGDATRSGYSIATIQEEIDKCDVRCANCHRRKTHKQFNYHINNR